jgi:Leucine-rich repeat (LRR) protein
MGLPHLAKLKKLQWLDLSLTLITDSGVPLLGKLKNLQRLNLWGTRITDAGVRKLQKALPRCEIIRR